jgi:hypothetical protein
MMGCSKRRKDKSLNPIKILRSAHVWISEKIDLDVRRS